MIDLDQPARRPTSPLAYGGWHRFVTTRVLVLVVAGSLLTGALLGGVATYVGWFRPLAASADRAAQAYRSTVSVQLFSEPGRGR